MSIPLTFKLGSRFFFESLELVNKELKTEALGSQPPLTVLEFENALCHLMANFINKTLGGGKTPRRLTDAGLRSSQNLYDKLHKVNEAALKYLLWGDVC